MSIPSTPQFPKPLSSDHQPIKSAYNTGLARISYFLNLTSKVMHFLLGYIITPR